MNNLYIHQESRKGFRGWTKQGLEFLLSLTSENRGMKYKIKKELEKYTKS
jgi:hypothetical protein